ncbi:MAG: PKD domain-containing protein [Bacteroidetes bacterium]|nr:PKD domain-containing protein [Bacteroidota bacterium]
MRFLPVLALLVVAHLTKAQSPIWADAWQIAIDNNATTVDFTVDPMGNNYFVGNFTGSVDIGTYTLSASNQDVYVAMVGDTGKVEWAIKLGGTNAEQAYRIAIDDSQNVYVTGSFLGAYNDGRKTFSNGGSYDGFLTKINAVGQVQWTVVATGTNIQIGKGVATDKSGYVYWFGDYLGSSDVAGTSISAAGSSYDVYLAKLNLDGKPIRVGAYGGNSLDQAFQLSVHKKWVYVTGTFTSSNFKIGSKTISTSGSYDVYLARLDTALSLSWLMKGGGSSIDGVGALHASKDGSVLITGFYLQAFAMGGKSISGGWYDCYAARVEANGSVSYIQNMTSSGFSQNINPTGIYGDAKGNMYVGGRFTSSMKVSTTTYTPKGGYDAFVLMFNKNGAFGWWNQGGGNNNDMAVGLGMDSLGYYYLGGYYSSSTKFGNHSLSGSGSTNNFAAKGTPPLNPPKFGGLKDRYVYVDSLFERSYAVKPSTTAQYALLKAPVGMSIDEASGNLTFTPGSTQVGSHRVVINAKNLAGSATDSFTIFVIKPLKLSLVMANLYLCENQPSTISLAHSEFGPLTVSWDWGDGNTGTGQSVNKTYAAAGQYVYKVLAVNGMDDKDSLSDTVFVAAGPVASMGLVSACQGDTVRIDNTSTLATGVITAHKWYLDGIWFSSKKQFTRFAATQDTTQVALWVVTDQGCADSVATTVQVTKKPVAKFSAYNACAGDEALFFDASSGGDIVSYAWEFGDGQKKKVSYPGMAHTYVSAGSFSARLTVTTSNGCTGTHSASLTVGSKPVMSFDVGNVCFGTPINLVDQSAAGQGAIVQRRWTTGDGKSYTKETATHTYKSPGKYTIGLIVANSLGCTDTLEKPIIVASKARASMVASAACANQYVTLRDSSEKGINDAWLSNKWYFDGKYMGSSSVWASKVSESPLVVKLKVQTAAGCVDSVEQTITPKPVVRAVFSLPDGCEGDTMRITEAFERNLLADVKWFGLGMKVISQDTGWAAVYRPGSIHQLFARTVSNNGCSDSAIFTGFGVFEAPAKGFWLQIDTPSKEVTFTANDLLASSYTWELDNGEGPLTLVVPGVVRTLSWNRPYHVRLVAMNANGCQSITDSLIVIDLPNGLPGQASGVWRPYPNPCAETLILTGVDGVPLWAILGADGRELIRGTGTAVPTQGLTPGAYLIRIELGQARQYVRFAKR